MSAKGLSRTCRFTLGFKSNTFRPRKTSDVPSFRVKYAPPAILALAGVSNLGWDSDDGSMAIGFLSSPTFEAPTTKDLAPISVFVTPPPTRKKIAPAINAITTNAPTIATANLGILDLAGQDTSIWTSWGN